MNTNTYLLEPESKRLNASVAKS